MTTDMQNNLEMCHVVQGALVMRNMCPTESGVSRILMMGVVLDTQFQTHPDLERIVKGKFLFIPDSVDITKRFDGWRMEDILMESDWAVVKPEDKVT